MIDRPAYRWVVLVAATLAQATTAVAMLGVGTLAGFIRDDLGLTTTQTGLLVTAAGLLPVLALIPTGRALDRRGERWIVSAGAVLLGAGTALASLTRSYAVLLVVLTAAGAGYASAQPGGSKAVAGWFAGRRRGLAMGIRQMGLPLGGAAAAGILPRIADGHGWRVAMLVAGGAAAGGGLLFAMVYRDHGRHRLDDAAFRWRMASLWRSPAVRPLLGSGFVLVSAQLVVISYLLIDLRDVHDIGFVAGGTVLLLTQVAGGIGRVVLAAATDRDLHRFTVVSFCLLATGTGLVVYGLLPAGTTPTAVIALLAAVTGFFGFGWYGPWVAHVADISDDDSMGSTLAFSMTANQLGIVIGPPVFGVLVDLSGTYWVAWGTVGLVMIGTGAAVQRAERRRLTSGGDAGPRG